MDTDKALKGTKHDLLPAEEQVGLTCNRAESLKSMKGKE